MFLGPKRGEPTYAWGKHANLKQKGPNQDSNQELSSYDATVLISPLPCSPHCIFLLIEILAYTFKI